MKLLPRLMVDDDTEYCDLGDDAQFVKRIESVYLYDESQLTHLCELAGSYYCEYLYTCIEFTDLADDYKRDELHEKYGYPGLEGYYIHADGIVAAVNLGEWDSTEEEYDTAFAEVVEYYNCNWYYG